LNSSLIDNEIRVWKTIHLGIAVAMPDGLIVPVIHSCNELSTAQIAVQLNALVARAKNAKLALADVTGGTFTLTNLGSWGIEQFNAIINPGQAGILAAGAIQPDVVAVNDLPVIRPMMRLTLSADHRILDGAACAQFLAALKEGLESPDLLLY
jgi:pyruvate dehydrogenase E2 component (dihydrolipoamide acetyltransferase)